jgi:signal transduction histidine kinase
MLPGRDGLEICEALKADPATAAIKVVLLTARTDERSKISALEKGADDFLTKPFSSVEVKTRLRNLFRQATLEEDLRQRNLDLQNALTRLRETEAQLVQTEKMNALGSLAAGLLHEINNPLNFTLTALEVARDSSAADPDLADTLNDIGQGMERIRDIVSDLRDFAYPSHAQARQPFGLSAALDTALRLLAHELQGVALSLSVPEGLTVPGSRTQIIQVFVNLLHNSARAVRSVADRRQPQIRVSADEGGGRVRVRVWDNGAGIEPQVLPRIFEPFFTTTDVGEGLGLGLSICHTIVKNHGGEMAARSQPGEWTQIEFDLPLEEAEVQRDHSAG